MTRVQEKTECVLQAGVFLAKDRCWGADEKAASLFLLWEHLLYPPPVSHWSQAGMSSKWQFLIGCHCLHHQSLGPQAHHGGVTSGLPTC